MASDDVKLTFNEWMAQLDARVHLAAGFRLKELPQQDWQARFDEGLSPEDCFDFHVRGELEDLGCRLEVADLFDAAEELGFNRLAGHVLAEASLDYITEGPFDGTAEEGAGDGPF